MNGNKIWQLSGMLAMVPSNPPGQGDIFDVWIRLQLRPNQPQQDGDSCKCPGHPKNPSQESEQVLSLSILNDDENQIIQYSVVRNEKPGAFPEKQKMLSLAQATH